MRIRMLKTITSGGIVYKAGSAYDVHPEVADAWARHSFCEQDKMIAAAPETKASKRTNKIGGPLIRGGNGSPTASPPVFHRRTA